MTSAQGGTTIVLRALGLGISDMFLSHSHDPFPTTIPPEYLALSGIHNFFS